MPKKKVAVALSDFVLDGVDEIAREREMSRSGVVEEALAQYVTRTRDFRHEAVRRARALAALEDARAFAREHEHEFTESSLEILRRIRAGEDDDE